MAKLLGELYALHIYHEKQKVQKYY